MAKKHTHSFSGTVLTYGIPGAGDASLDLNAIFPGFASLSTVAQEMVKFSAKTLARNATAGLMDDADKATALKRIEARFKNFLDGVWRSGGGAEAAERPTSMLARALAEALGIEAEEAASRIAALIDANVTKAGLSPDEEDDKEKIRAIAAGVRKAVAETKEVTPILARIKAEEAAKRAEAAKTVKADAPSIAGLMQR